METEMKEWNVQSRNPREIECLDNAGKIFTAYQRAFDRDDRVSLLLIEWSDKYYE